MEKEGSCQIILNKSFDLKMSQVISPNFYRKGLYIGGAQSLQPKVLKEHNIKAIITILSKYQLKSIPDVSADLPRLIIDVTDTSEQQIDKYFGLSNTFIDKQIRSGNVLVNCFAGKSRSATIVAAYLISAEHMTLKQALHHLRNKRHIIKPNNGFMEQLINFQASNLCQQSHKKRGNNFKRRYKYKL